MKPNEIPPNVNQKVRMGIDVLAHLVFDRVVEHASRPFAQDLVQYRRGGDCHLHIGSYSKYVAYLSARVGRGCS